MVESGEVVGNWTPLGCLEDISTLIQEASSVLRASVRTFTDILKHGFFANMFNLAAQRDVFTEHYDATVNVTKNINNESLLSSILD